MVSIASYMFKTPHAEKRRVIWSLQSNLLKKNTNVSDGLLGNPDLNLSSPFPIILTVKETCKSSVDMLRGSFSFSYSHTERGCAPGLAWQCFPGASRSPDGAWLVPKWSCSHIGPTRHGRQRKTVEIHLCIISTGQIMCSRKVWPAFIH